MPRIREEEGREAAVMLRQIELDIETAFGAAARLNASLPAFRQRMRLSPVTGQRIYEAAGEVQTSLCDARRHSVTLHAELEELRLQLKLPPITAGPGEDKPPKDPNYTEASPWPFMQAPAETTGA